MGYNTDFFGELTITPPLNAEQVAYIQKFSDTRRMKRDAIKAALMEDNFRIRAGLPLGNEAEYFVGGLGFMGQDNDDSVVDYNTAPGTQPGLWCQWTVSSAGDSLVWNEHEKFYHSEEWLEYVAEHFFARWGCKLEGQIRWQGEESDDRGTIHVKDNRVQAIEDQITTPDPIWD